MKRAAPRRTVLVAHPSAELYGSDRVLLESVSALVGDGCDVLVAIPSPGPLVPLLEERGARVVICSTPVLRKSSLRPAGLIRLVGGTIVGAGRAAAILARERPQLVYVNTLTIPLWLAMAKLARVPTLCHVHEGESGASRALRTALSLPLHLADQVIANSAFSVAVLASAAPRIARRTRVVYNGVAHPPHRRMARRLQIAPIRLVYVGRLSPRKGVDVAIAAVRLLRERGVEVRLDLVGAVFAGYEWYETELRELVTDAGLTGVVRFHGFQDSVWRFIDAGDIVLVPSRLDEPFGNTAVEAVLRARPVIASATSGLLEATKGYDCASLVDAGDPAALAHAVEAIAANWAEVREAAWADGVRAEARHAPAVYRAEIAAVARKMWRRNDPGSRHEGHRGRADLQATH